MPDRHPAHHCGRRNCHNHPDPKPVPRDPIDPANPEQRCPIR